MIGTKDVNRIQRATAYDRSGSKIGKVGQLYVDRQTHEPRWITVSTGFFGTSESFVPLEGADFDGDDIRVAYDKDTVKDAPRIDADRELEAAEEQQLYRHYHLTGERQATGHTAGEGMATGRTETGRTETEQAMTLSEERLAVEKERVEAGHARLRKYTTSHTETVEVPVTKEKLVVERTPVTGEHTGGHISESGEQVEEITLHEERPVVSKETVPVEEVRVGKQTVTETEQVSDEVRKEQADLQMDNPEGELRPGESRHGETRPGETRRDKGFGPRY